MLFRCYIFCFIIFMLCYILDYDICLGSAMFMLCHFLGYVILSRLCDFWVMLFFRFVMFMLCYFSGYYICLGYVIFYVMSFFSLCYFE